jgi:hypothetical protein
MYYQLGFSAIVLLISFLTFSTLVIKKPRKKRDNDALVAGLLRKIAIAERMLRSVSLTLPNETLIALNMIILTASRHLDLINSHSSYEGAYDVQRRINELENSENEHDYAVIPQDNIGRKLAMQELFRLHQFFRNQIKIGDGSVSQFQIEVRRIEMAILVAKIKSASMAGTQAILLHKLGSARERFYFIVKTLERNQSFRKQFVSEYQFAHEQLTLIKRMVSTHRITPVASDTQDSQPQEKESDGLDKMFSDNKSTWIPQ